MKTSKVILFSYIGTLAIAFLVFVIYLKVTDKDRRNKEDSSFVAYNVELPDFSHVRFDHQNAVLASGDEDVIIIRHHKDSLRPELNWHLDADTLVIEQTRAIDELKLQLSSRNSFHIDAKASQLRFRSLRSDSLFLKGVKSGFLDFVGCNVSYIKADLKQSRLQSFHSSFKYGDINLNRSKVNIHKPMKSIQGVGINKSELLIKQARRINLEMDESSKLRCY